MRDLAAGPFGSAADGGKHLLDQPDLAVGRSPERPKVPGFDAICRKGARRPGDRERRLSIVPTRVGTHQPESGERLKGGPVQAGGFAQLGVCHPKSATAAQRRGALRMTDAELREASGLDRPTFEALSTFGLVRPDSSGHYGEPSLAVARAASALAAYGIEPRHLRAFRTAADREIGLVQQVLSPIRGRTKGAGGKVAHDPTSQILAECIALHTALVKAGIAAE